MYMPDSLCEANDLIGKRDGARLPTILLGAAGAALTTAALPFLVGTGGADWWHWVIGGVGVVGVGVGIALAAQEGSCVDAACSDRNRTLPLGTSVLFTSVPLVALPIMALLFESGDDAPPPSVSLAPWATGDGGGLTFGGSI
jgi:hypothetical protein